MNLVIFRNPYKFSNPVKHNGPQMPFRIKKKRIYYNRICLKLHNKGISMRWIQI